MRANPTFQTVWDKVHDSGDSLQALIPDNRPKKRVWRDSYGITHVVTYATDGTTTHKMYKTHKGA